jgi:hypothetical protein
MLLQAPRCSFAQHCSTIVARSFVAVGLVASVVAAFAPGLAEAETSVEDLIVTEAPRGFELYEGDDALSGPVTLEQLAALTGGDPDQFDEAEGYSAAARTWDSPDGRVFVLMFDVGNERSAAEALSGAVDSINDKAGKRFETGVEGTIGFITQTADTTIFSATWRQGPYFVLTTSFSVDALGSQRRLRDLVARQSARIEGAVGKSPSVELPTPPDTSVAYRLGRVFGALLIPGLIIGAIALIARRKKPKLATAPFSPNVPGPPPSAWPPQPPQPPQPPTANEPGGPTPI